jgi:hypothetical protein
MTPSTTLLLKLPVCYSNSICMTVEKFLGYSVNFYMAKRDFAIHLITLHNILEYMKIAIVQTEAADFVKMYICVILKTFVHSCSTDLPPNPTCRSVVWDQFVVQTGLHIYM